MTNHSRDYLPLVILALLLTLIVIAAVSVSFQYIANVEPSPAGTEWQAERDRLLLTPTDGVWRQTPYRHPELPAECLSNGRVWQPRADGHCYGEDAQ